ncbi:MAG: hypothetical protein AABY64_01840 [Bdellovibrionota bacterium]
MNKTFMILNNQKGQFVIEAILLMVLSLGLLMAGTRYLREKKAVQAVVQGPWSRVATMTESGIWAPNTPQQIRRHPNTAQNRGVTLLEFQ